MKWNEINHIFHIIVNPVICGMIFILEIGMVIILFNDFAGGWSWYAPFYFQGVAIVMMIGEMRFVYDIKRKWAVSKEYYWSRIGAYAFTLVVFLIAALCFNLRSLQENSKKSQVSDKEYVSISQTIDDNIDAIQEYKAEWRSETNTIKKLNLRNLMNSLTSNDNVLLSQIKQTTSETKHEKVDSFGLLENLIKIPARWIKFIFLCCIFGAMAYFLFITLPVGAVEEAVKQEGVQSADDSVKTFIKENQDDVRKFVSSMFRNPAENRLLKSTDLIVSETGINPEIAARIWKILAYHLFIKQGKEKVNLIKPFAGKTEAMFSLKEITDGMENFINA